jgi:hypothetical protein
MSQRAALYTIRVRSGSTSGAPIPLGDIDGSGETLLSVLQALLADFRERSGDGMRTLRVTRATTDGDRLFASLQRGESGVAAEIESASGSVRLRQSPHDVQLVRCGCAFSLPASWTTGWLAAHVNNGRGLKELFERGLATRFQAEYPRLVLEIAPYVSRALLTDAVAGGRVEGVKLLKHVRAGEAPLPLASPWLDAGQEARVGLAIAAVGPGSGVRPGLLGRFLAGDANAFSEIVSTDGGTFDDAFVDVTLPDGTRRTFDLKKPATGRPELHDLAGLELDLHGEPTEASLFASLAAILPTQQVSLSS